MEEEDCSPQNAIDERDGAIEARILFIGGQSPHGEAGKDQRHDDQVGSLHDLGRGLLSLVNARKLSEQEQVKEEKTMCSNISSFK